MTDNQLQVFMPMMGLADVVQRRNSLVDFVEQAMKKDIDYGVIPGATKPTLLKPGAEKLCTLFGLSPRFTILKSVEDWTGKEYNGEPFFFYLYHCSLYRGDYLLGEGDGSCSSRESKYRYRNSNRVCPACGKETIIKGKEEYGGGWLCFVRRGGCGAKFVSDAPEIMNQSVGRVVNMDVADQANTILKMSQKRSLIAATLVTVNASEFFSQDVEDMVIDGTAVIVEEKKQEKQEQKQPERAPQATPVKPMSDKQREAIVKLYSQAYSVEDQGTILGGIDGLFKETFANGLGFDKATMPEASAIIKKLMALNDENKEKAK